MSDQSITCADCGLPFTFTEGEQEFYASKQLSPPKRCKACRDLKKQQRESGRRGTPRHESGVPSGIDMDTGEAF